MGTFRAREIFNNPGRTIIAIESVDFRYGSTNAICRLHGKTEPIAVIVCTPDATYAVDMAAKPITLDQLRQDIPQLDTIIAPFETYNTDIRD